MNSLKSSNSLASIVEQHRRIDMLSQPHMEPLREYHDKIRAQHPEKNIPYFDPRDGGIQARALLLMLAVGPKPMGSPFLSIDNTNVTARNFRELLDDAKIARNEILLWNIIPWYVGTDSEGKREIKERNVEQGLGYVEDLINLLSQLKVIILLGGNVQIHKSKIRKMRDLPLVEAAHPSPQAFNGHRGLREKTQSKFLEAACYINR